MEKQGQKNFGAIVAILLILIFLANPQIREQLLFSLDPFLGAEDFVPYSDFSTNIIDPSEWAVTKFGSSSSQGFDVSSTNRPAFFLNAGCTTSDSCSAGLRFEAVKDLRAKNFKMFYTASSGGGSAANNIVGGPSVSAPGNNIDPSCTIPTLSPPAQGANAGIATGSIELTSSVIDDNRYRLTVNDIGCDRIMSSGEKLILSINWEFTKGANSEFGSASVLAWDPGWKPTLGCGLDDNDVLAIQVFDDQDVIDITSLQYPLGGGLKKFCLNNPAIIIKPDATGFDSEILQFLAGGETIDVGSVFGEGSNVVLQYIVDAQEAGLPTVCTEDEALVDNSCEDKTNLVFPFTTGTLNLATLTLTVSSEPECDNPNAVLVIEEDGTATCRINLPETGICEVGTLNPDTGLCEFTPPVENVCNVGEFNSESGFCELDGSVVGEPFTQSCQDSGGVLNEEGQCITVLKEPFTFLRGIAIPGFIILLVILAFMFFKRRKK